MELLSLQTIPRKKKNPSLVIPISSFVEFVTLKAKSPVKQTFCLTFVSFHTWILWLRTSCWSLMTHSSDWIFSPLFCHSRMDEEQWFILIIFKSSFVFLVFLFSTFWELPGQFVLASPSQPHVSSDNGLLAYGIISHLVISAALSAVHFKYISVSFSLAFKFCNCYTK